MKLYDLGTRKTILNQFLSEIRNVDIQKDRMRFRQNIERIGHIMAYEISQSLTYEEKDVTTPLGVAKISVPTDNIVLGTVFRAGIPLHKAFLDIFDESENAFVSAYRYYTNAETKDIGISVDYMATPRLDNKTLIIVDPMLATGESMELAYKALETKGKPNRLILACVIAAKEGIEHLQKVFPEDDIKLFCATIDPYLNENKYIVPGLGDAGDLMYGEKLSK